MRVLKNMGRKLHPSRFGNGFIYDIKSTGNRNNLEKRDSIILYKSVPQVKQSRG